MLASATPETADELIAIAKDNGHALALTAPTLDELVALAAKVKAGGFNDLLLQFQTQSPAERFQTQSIARRLRAQPRGAKGMSMRPSFDPRPKCKRSVSTRLA